MKNKKEVIKEKMLKEIFATLVLATIVFASSALVSAETISSIEAEKIASEYSSESEYAELKVELLYRNDTPYHIVGFFDETTNEYQGSVIVDALSGEIVRNEAIAREISFAMVLTELGMGTPEAHETDLRTIDQLQNAVTYYEDQSKNLTERAEKTGTSTKLKGALKDASSAYDVFANDFFKMGDIVQECYELGEQWEVKKDTAIAKEVVSKNDEMSSYLSTSFISNLEKVNNSVGTLYDTMISETTDPTEKASLEMEKEFTLGMLSFAGLMLIHPAVWADQKAAIIEGSEDVRGVNWEVEKMGNRVAFEAITTLIPSPKPTLSPSPTPTPTPSPTPAPTPGFEAVFTIAGLLIVVYILRKRV